MSRKDSVRTPRSLNHSFVRNSGRLSLSPSLRDGRVRARSSLPMLQAQSAESRMCSRELRITSAQLKHRLASLRKLKTALQRKHAAACTLMLRNEEALMKEKTKPPSDAPQKAETVKNTWGMVSAKVAAVQETRAKHLIEVQLFKQSADEKLGAEPEITSTVLELMRKQLALYETQIAAHTLEEKALEARFEKELSSATAELESVRSELSRLRKEQTRRSLQEMTLRRKLFLAESVPPVRNGAAALAALDQSSQSARDLLISLKIRLGSSSGRMMKYFPRRHILTLKAKLR